MLEEDTIQVYVSSLSLWFKKFDYKTLDSEDYLSVIEGEEMLHVLASYISKSAKLKKEFVDSGTFRLFIQKMDQVLNFFNKERYGILTEDGRSGARASTTTATLGGGKSNV